MRRADAFNMVKRAAALTLGLTLALPAMAADVTVADPWVREPVGPNAAAYMTLENTGALVSLVGVTSDAAARVAVHGHKLDGDVSHMHKVDQLVLSPDDVVAMKPGGLHVMLMGLVAPLKEGDMVSLTLHFSDGDTLAVKVPVTAIDAMAAPMHHHHE